MAESDHTLKAKAVVEDVRTMRVVLSVLKSNGIQVPLNRPSTRPGFVFHF